MHIHILGICGTFMGGIAQLARAAGHSVSGSDANVYPPMSTQLQAAGIDVLQGFEPSHLDPAPDCVVVGNVMSRGRPIVEYMLERGMPYTSGPQWLAEHVLAQRWVLAVAGTHGKTTTASMLAWIMEDAGLAPGFLIGGVPQNFGVSARFGEAPFFVVEADEYDTAFFDKRSKFVHYRPRTVTLNNLEFDHADIFDDVAAIRRQFHHLVRTVPANGLIISNSVDAELETVLAMGCWTPVERFAVAGIGPDWSVGEGAADGSRFEVRWQGKVQGTVNWDLLGQHNVANALAAIAAARHAGVPVPQAIDALGRFENVRRRLELLADIGGIRIYDDFAHHPTAIASTLAGLRARVDGERIIALLEARSNTMRLGVHKDRLAAALNAADEVRLLRPAGLTWDIEQMAAPLGARVRVFDSVARMADHVGSETRAGDHVLIMSNGAFGGIHQLLIDRLRAMRVGAESPS